MCSAVHENARFDSVFAFFWTGGTKHGAPDQLPPSARAHEANPVLGAAATEAALAAMSAIIHQKARSGSMSAIFGRGGTKRGTPVTMVASDRSGEVNSVMPRKCAPELQLA